MRWRRLVDWLERVGIIPPLLPDGYFRRPDVETAHLLRQLLEEQRRNSPSPTRTTEATP